MENANALQLEAARATPALCRFNYGAMPSLMSPLPYYSVFAADTLLYDVTLTSDPVTLTFDFDLEHLQHIACDVMKLCTKCERNRTIRGGVIAISVFDLMTLNMFKCNYRRSTLN